MVCPQCGQVVVRSTTSLLTVIMDHVSSTEVQKLDEEGKAVFVQHAKTFLDGLQTLLNAIRLAKADAPVKINMHQYFGLLYCIVFSWHLTNIEEI